jgi:arabinofuranosyltransferase
MRSHLTVALLATFVAVGFFLWREHTTAGVFGFPLDDSWIHAQFARNLALGHGFSYNPGEPVSGSTAPLWTLVTATGYLVTGDPVLAGKLLGVLFLALTVFFTYVLVRTISDDAREALFAAIVVGTLPRLVWASLSGMEITLAVTLTLAGILAHILYQRTAGVRQYLATVLFGLATLARPECAVFFAAAMIDRILVSILIRWREVAARDWVVPLLIHVAVFAVVVLPFVVFSAKFGVGFLPNTAYAKALYWNRGLLNAVARGSTLEVAKSFTVYPYDYFMSFLQESLSNNPILFVASIFGFLGLVFSLPYGTESRLRSFIIPLSVVLFPVAIGIVVPFGTASFQEGRYAAPIAPLMLIMGTIGLYAAAHHAAHIFAAAKSLGRPAKLVLERSLIWLLMFLTISCQVRTTWYRGRVYGMEVANINEMQVATGKWVDQNLPKNAFVATNDIGAIAYFSGRRLLDTVGLISPEVLDDVRAGIPRDDAVFALLARERPDYAILFPTWYPELVKRRPLFQMIHRVVLKENMIAGGDELVVYRLDWELPASSGVAQKGSDSAVRDAAGTPGRSAPGAPPREGADQP